MKYHAHIYFDLTQIELIESLYVQLQQEFGEAMSYGRIHQKLVGPHTKPMFQLAFDQAVLPQLKHTLNRRHLGLSVLIHPLWENEYLAHTEGAQWLGESLILNLDRLLK
ncbi:MULTISPECIES: DOPA 4,5-dioxygenase family protein [Acinetobacter]|uniref:DOPA 4,5-dioxygenase family protein n=1 Tax=Acinetobacter TaxID=469 RepID=UPI00101F2B3E|nr:MULTISPECIES: DOPA 4,5-dioxygenase family protein [Acinetobacter]RYL25322.1 4,5-dioxygenase [Acinetobacter piscicola]